MSQALLDPTLPTETDDTLARETSRLLAPRMRSKIPLRLRIGDFPKEETMQLPALVVKMLVRILMWSAAEASLCCQFAYVEMGQAKNWPTSGLRLNSILKRNSSICA